MMMSEKSWYAIYTKPRAEKKVAELLTKQQVEHVCPVLKIGRHNHSTDRQKKLLDPIFAGYIFVCIPESSMGLVKQTEGVLNFVYWYASPASIAAGEIHAMQFLMDENSNLHFEKIGISATPRIRTLHGPFLDWTGYAPERNIRTVKIFLPSLGVTISSEVSMSRNEKVRFINASGLPLIPLDATTIKTHTGS